MNLYELTVSEACRQINQGDLTAEELTQSCLTRIETVEKNLHAFITLDKEGAIKQAVTIDKRRKNGQIGRLAGIPLSIKDVFATKGMRTTCGSKILENFIPPYDATVVSKVKNEGAIIIGKATMDEFAMGSSSETCAFGVPQNPYKKGYVAGGSSGGSAVSVASYECLASLGSDTGGSIRQPASLCGIVGLKPTYGRVSRYGLTAFASSLDQAGPLCRTVEDCALMMSVISGHDPLDSTSVKKEVPDYKSFLTEGLTGVKIGVPKEYFSEGLDPEVRKIVLNSLDIFRERGAKIVEVTLPHTEYCVAAYYLIAPSEASSNLARYDGVHYGYRDLEAKTLLEMYKRSRSQGFGSEVKRRILIGTYALSSGYYDAYFRKASQVRTLILNDYLNAFQSCDVLVSPVTPTPAWRLGENSEDPLSVYLSDILTLSANLAGVPGMSVPGGFTASGLPVGVQIQGPHFREELLMKVGFNLEQALHLPKTPMEI